MRNYVTTYDPFFDLFFAPSRSNERNYMMDTDVIDQKDHYEMKVNLPNVTKENVKVSLNNGYLTIEATTSKENNANKENFIIRERKVGTYSRSFYIGEDTKMSDISAKMNNGVLELEIKKPTKEEVESNRYIEIQ